MPYITVDEKYKKDIHRAQFECKIMLQRQEALVREIGDKLGIKDGTDEYEILWDHILNGTSYSVEYIIGYKKD